MTEIVDTGTRTAKILDQIKSNDNGDLFILAEVNGEVAGTLKLTHFTRSQKTDHVRTLGMEVLKDYRSMGVGSALLNYALNWGKEAGIVKIILDVFETNQRAIGLYKKFGFEIEGNNRKVAKIMDKYVDLINFGLFLNSLQESK